MSFVACCQEIDRLREENADLQGVVRQQVEDIRGLQNRLAKAEEERDGLKMRWGFGTW